MYRDFVLLDHFLPWNEVAEASEGWVAVNQMQKETYDETPPLFLDYAPVKPGGQAAQKVLNAGGVENIVADDGDSQAGGAGPVNDAALAANDCGAPVVTPEDHVYLKTAYVPVTPPYCNVLPKANIDPLLRRLVPVSAVQMIVAEHIPANIHVAVGVHVRSRSVDRDKVDVDRACEFTTDGAATTDYCRQQSQVPGLFGEDEPIRCAESLDLFLRCDRRLPHQWPAGGRVFRPDSVY